MKLTWVEAAGFAKYLFNLAHGGWMSRMYAHGSGGHRYGGIGRQVVQEPLDAVIDLDV